MQHSFIPYSKPNVIYIDVDGTLIINNRANQTLVDWARLRFLEGKEIIVWSARGADNARRAVEICGIGDIVSHTLSKPGYVVDDLGHGFTRYMDIIQVSDIDQSNAPKQRQTRVSMI
ncbi:hypothetical protein A1507_05805 [Methylomonas koyamae]|uniref:Uncharacterized protein n=1 Tax=Methylomonas koyamae TaxID=702114 RepID=A0A177NP84_9GAMM|nr:hypothetical protein [Methylomonas koyamae]OAI19867.1 hypothetical protein A1507_05805 [Methylomonas koyamae]